MILLSLPDIHGDIANIGELTDELASADLALLVGDITHFGGEPEARRIVDAIRQVNPQVLAVAGNCDYPEVEDYLCREGLSLHRRAVLVEGIEFLGVGSSLPCPGRTPNEISDADFERYLEEAGAGVLPGAPMILVAHQPPSGTINDLASMGDHVGSKAVRSFVEAHQPLLCLTGHIHEGIGIDTLGNTKVVNPGPWRHNRYALARIAGDTVEEVVIRDIGP
jgi:Icc-related predicted phosphoesterase